MVTAGTGFTITVRPPNSAPEPGRICSVVTPAASARENAGSPGSHGMLDPGVGDVRIALLDDVRDAGFGGTLRQQVHPVVGVDIDDAGRDPAAAGIDHGRALVRKRVADRHDATLAHQHFALLEPPARAVQDRRAREQRVHARQRLVATGRSLEHRLARRGGGRRGRDGGAETGAVENESGRAPGGTHFGVPCSAISSASGERARPVTISRKVAAFSSWPSLNVACVARTRARKAMMCGSSWP